MREPIPLPAIRSSLAAALAPGWCRCSSTFHREPSRARKASPFRSTPSTHQRWHRSPRRPVRASHLPSRLRPVRRRRARRRRPVRPACSALLLSAPTFLVSQTVLAWVSQKAVPAPLLAAPVAACAAAVAVHLLPLPLPLPQRHPAVAVVAVAEPRPRRLLVPLVPVTVAVAVPPASMSATSPTSSTRPSTTAPIRPRRSTRSTLGGTPTTRSTPRTSRGLVVIRRPFRTGSMLASTRHLAAVVEVVRLQPHQPRPRAAVAALAGSTRPASTN